MTAIDLTILKETLSNCISLFECSKNALLHSPVYPQIAAFADHFKIIQVVSIENWNILNGKHEETNDILYFGNVLFYINDPKTAIENALKSCKYLIIQDVIYRDRSGHGTEFHGTDGDCMRFSYKNDIAKVDNAYSLDYLNPIYYKSYIDKEYLDSKHFIMILKNNEV